MKRASFVIAFTAIAGAALMISAAVAEDAHQILTPDTVKWGPAPPALPKGAMLAVMSGDPSKTGMYIVRVKMPAGYAVPPHWHSQTENISVMSGTFNVAMGDALDKSKGRPLSPQGFVMMPSPMHHYAWASEDTIIQISGMGPFDIHYVNPQDDPRGKAASD